MLLLLVLQVLGSGLGKVMPGEMPARAQAGPAEEEEEEEGAAWAVVVSRRPESPVCAGIWVGLWGTKPVCPAELFRWRPLFSPRGCCVGWLGALG